MSKVSQLLFFVWTSASFSISLSLDERMDGDGRTDGGHKKKTRLKKKGKKIIIIKEKRCTTNTCKKRAAQKEPPLSSSLCRVETSDIVEGPWCSSSVRGAGREERRTNSFERTRGFGQLRETTSGERH
jgi:hypothetical protein|tara:strand:- start:7565 stop:7948 length:384 start_codon:yes stop_codon:yes gene_type:complete